MIWRSGFCISKVRFDKDGKRIQNVEIQQKRDDVLGPKRIWSRDRVISLIHIGFSIYTIPPEDSGFWEEGNKVHLVEVDGFAYLRADDREVEGDDLGKLPDF